jgi:hypothetical protein
MTRDLQRELRSARRKKMQAVIDAYRERCFEQGRRPKLIQITATGVRIYKPESETSE